MYRVRVQQGRHGASRKVLFDAPRLLRSDGQRGDAAVSEGIRDALRAETDAERLRAPPTGLTTGSVASLLPAWPVPARVALQAGVAAAGWAGRISEEPKGAVGLAVGMAAAATPTAARTSSPRASSVAETRLTRWVCCERSKYLILRHGHVDSQNSPGAPGLLISVRRILCMQCSRISGRQLVDVRVGPLRARSAQNRSEPPASPLRREPIV